MLPLHKKTHTLEVGYRSIAGCSVFGDDTEMGKRQIAGIKKPSMVKRAGFNELWDNYETVL